MLYASSQVIDNQLDDDDGGGGNNGVLCLFSQVELGIVVSKFPTLKPKNTS